MSNVIDSFLVALGFDIDDESVKDSTKALDDVRTRALAMGGALSASFVKAGFVAKNTAKDITEVYNTSKLLGSVGVSQLDAYRYAFKQVGGSVEDAEATLASFESLLANASIGEGPFEALEKAGIPASLLTDTRTSIELLEKLASIFPRLTDEQKKLASGALGLNRGADLLLRQGPDHIQQLLEEAEQYGVITDSMGEHAEELTQALDKLGQAWQNLLNNFTERASPGMADAAKDLADALTQFEALSDRLGAVYGDNFSVLGPAAAVGTGAAAVGAAGAAAKGAKFAKLGSTLTGAAKFGMTKIAAPLTVASMWDLDQDIERMTGFDPKDNPYTGWLFRPLREMAPDWMSKPWGDLIQDTTGIDLQKHDTTRWLVTPWRDLLGGDKDKDMLRPQAFHDSRDSIMPPQSSIQHTDQSTRIDRIDIRVDGAGNPEAVADRVMEKINEVAFMAKQEFRTASAG